MMFRKTTLYMLIAFAVTVLFVQPAAAQWVVDPHLYNTSMTMTIAVRSPLLENIACDSLQVVALSGSECRGVESPTYIAYQGQNYQLFFLTIYGNDGDNLNLMVWDQTIQHVVYQDTASIVFTTNEMIGLPMNPYLLYNGYQVFFDANGGVGEMAPQTFAHQIAQVLPSNTFHNGNKFFNGWSLQPSGCSQFEDQALFSTDKTDTLYAVWQSVSEITETACESFLWDDSTYTQSGDYVRYFPDVNGCDSMVTLHLTIYPRPDVSIIGPDSVNYGENVTLLASGAYSYVWDVGATTPVMSDTVFSATTYSVTGTNGYGCTATAVHTINTNNIAPMVVTNLVSDVGPAGAICGGNVVSSGGAAVTSRGVCWSMNPHPTIADSHTTDGLGMGVYVSTITGLAENTTYYVRAYATNSVSTCYGEEFSFTTPCAPLALSFSDSVSLCIGESVTLTAAGADTYAWSTGGQESSITVSPTTTTGYSVTATKENGCQAVEAVTVVVSPLPTVGIAGNTSISYGQSTTLVAHGASSYAWSTGSSTSVVTVSPIVTTTYSVTGTSAAGCSSMASATVQVAQVLPAVVIAEITEIGNHTAKVTVSVLSSGSSDVIERGVCWSTSSMPTTMDNHTNEGVGESEFFTIMEDLQGRTTYYVRAFATNELGTAYSEEWVFTTTNVGVEDLVANGRITAYPNPTTDKVVVRVNDSNSNISLTILYDATGRKLREVQWQPGSQTQEIDLNGLSAGLYYLEMLSENKNLGKTKIVKQ